MKQKHFTRSSKTKHNHVITCYYCITYNLLFKNNYPLLLNRLGLGKNNFNVVTYQGVPVVFYIFLTTILAYVGIRLEDT